MTKSKKKTLPLEEVFVREDLYPRLPDIDIDSSVSFRTVDSYKLVLDELPPIVINQDNILIDGWHRLEAYKEMLQDIEEGRVDEDVHLRRGFDPSRIEVIVIQTDSEEQVLLEAARANAHGQVVMTRKEKRDVAERLTKAGVTDQEIAEALALPRSTVNYWTKEYHEAELRRKKELVYEYADKHPKKKQVEIRKMILEEHNVEVPHSSHSDWLRDREKTEAAWSEEAVEALPGGVATEGMTYEEYVTGLDSGAGEVETPMVATAEARPTPAAPLPEYICDGYDVKQKGVSKKEYLQTGCLKCKSLRSTPFVGLHHEGSCGKGHQTVITGWKRDR